ncbi:unnamed protein product [Mytilus coruscus]|uniref:MAM domain-containing protein n=1 Tax=Mytilus coruscus TaxID=42192 RepID=A0A6J8AND6_MYTCO|nr:unnamed protein product [Mytilus coruscus]
MYIESSGKDRNDIAQLISKPIVCKHVQCLTFWYHMYGNRIGSLYVYKKNRTQMDIVWERHGNQQNQWREAYMNLYCDEEFQIVIEGKIKDSFQRRLGDIALDDIYLFEGSCENGVKIICTFEDQQACGLNNAFDEPEYLSWTIEQDMATANGPAVDHTIGSENGFFFHLKSLEDSGKGRLESSLITFIGPKCLIIWYYIIGNNANNLTLYQMSIDGKREIMSVHGDTEENWKKSTISVYIALNDKIIIEGSIKQIGSISLDDISLSEGACIEDKEYNDSCLRINQQYEIEGCATLYLQRESLNITLHPSFTNSNNEKECTNQNEVGGELYNFCRDNYLYSNCKFNLETFYSDYSECFTFNKKILITYLCTDRKTTTVSSDSTSGDSSAGLVVGLIIGALLLLCVVILIVVLIRRHTFKSNPREQIRNNLGGNDYIGSQDTALPLTANHSSHMQNNGMYDGSSNNSVHGYDSTNVNVQHEYTNVGAVNGFVNKEKVQVPTYAHRQVKTFADNHMSNDDEYAIVDPTAETSINETIGNRTGTADSYMVFDPTETGFNRQIFSNSPVGYEFAKPVKDTENKICDEDQYDISNEGIYDHSGSNRHKESDDNIYNHAVDTIYDSGSHKRNNERREDTYDHFFGQKTVDEYDVSTTT